LLLKRSSKSRCSWRKKSLQTNVKPIVRFRSKA